MKAAVSNSARRGYHRQGMDFSRVHASGGSRIMRRGDSVSLGKLSHVDVFDSWQFRNGQCYLDASALLFDYQGNFVASVDYMRNHYSGVTHSGDQMTHQKGTHEVNLDLSRLPKRVQSVYIVLS